MKAPAITWCECCQDARAKMSTNGIPHCLRCECIGAAKNRTILLSMENR